MTWDTAPLYSGRAVHERFLNARVMHFSKFPFWECSAALATEIYPTRLEANIQRFPDLSELQRQWLTPQKALICELPRFLILLSIFQILTNRKIAPSLSLASRDHVVTLFPDQSLSQPLIHVVSIHTISKCGSPFGQLMGGELLLKGFLFGGVP